MYYGRSLGEASKACHTLLESTPTSMSAYIKHCLFIVIGVRLVSLVVGIYDIQGCGSGLGRVPRMCTVRGLHRARRQGKPPHYLAFT